MTKNNNHHLKEDGEDEDEKKITQKENKIKETFPIFSLLPYKKLTKLNWVSKPRTTSTTDKTIGRIKDDTKQKNQKWGQKMTPISSCSQGFSFGVGYRYEHSATHARARLCLQAFFNKKVSQILLCGKLLLILNKEY